MHSMLRLVLNLVLEEPCLYSPSSLLSTIMFHLPAPYSFNKLINYHCLQTNHPLPMRHSIFIRGHGEQNYCVYPDNKSIVSSQKVNRFAWHEPLLTNLYFSFVLPQLLLYLKSRKKNAIL